MNVRTFSIFFALLTVMANVIVLAIAVEWFAGKVFGARRRLRRWIAPGALPLAWAVAAVSMGGSLYYSEGAGYVPCTLCWYQRIAMYPMVLLLGIAAVRGDTLIRRYVIPLSLLGATISIYHYQLQRFPNQTSFSCTRSTPCSLTYVWEFHYISIPFMALSGFLLIATLLATASASKEDPG